VTGEPITVSMALNLRASDLHAAGAIDVSLNCDTSLFIDPLLFSEASDPEFRQCASRAYERRFEQIMALLEQSASEGDFAWRNAERLLTFHEIKYTHLGYASGAWGTGFGDALRSSLIRNARDAVRLGSRNPDLFMVLALFESNVGPDRISDMSTNIALSCLADFTTRISRRLNIGIEDFLLDGRTYLLPRNPLVEGAREPLVLVPKDVVRDLPVAADWSALGAAARQTEDLKARVSAQIGEIWTIRSRREKQRVRDVLIRNREALELMLRLLREAVAEPYDVDEDHLGEIYPADLRRQIAAQAPLDLSAFRGRQLESGDVDRVVREILQHFRWLVEDNGIWELLYDDDRTTARRERAAQRLFFAIAAAYCSANEIDLSPESNAGNGPVDFKLSRGSRSKVLVEVKKSNNVQLLDGYQKQLSAYVSAERSIAAHYVVLEMGRFSAEKRRALEELRDNARSERGRAAEIWFIDATPKPSATRR